MARKRYSDEDVLNLLRQIELSLASGSSIEMKHQLQPYKMDELANWIFADWVFARDWDIILEDRKRIRHGYTEIIYTEEMFARYFKKMRDMRIIPPAPN
jgi:hypothetical protein